MVDRARAGRWWLLALGSILSPGGCGAPTPVGEPPAPPAGLAWTPTLLAAELDADARRWVDETLASLSTRELVAQLVMQWTPGAFASTSGSEFQEVRELVEAGIGGLYLSIGTPHTYAAKVNELQALARVPLLFASDFEDGGPGMRINHTYSLPGLLAQGGGTAFPPTMAFGAIGDETFAREYGRITGAEAAALGVRLNFAPILDVNSNPDNPVIATRSFGGDPELVARLGAAFIRGSREGGVLATAKHFPGHGDTEIDSHLGLPISVADRARLDSVELVPFRRAVGAGVDAVMTAHISLPGLLGFDAPPATLSPEILTSLLRRDLGFTGLVITDALTMSAVSEGWGEGEAAILALEAGADLLLGSRDMTVVVEAVVGAVDEGRVPLSRVRESAQRILELKARAGLQRARFVDLDRVDDLVGTGPHRAFADRAAERSMTLVRDRLNAVPLAPGARRVLSVTFAPDRDPVAGSAFDARLREGLAARGDASGVRAVRLEPGSAPAEYAFLDRALEEADAVVVGVYTTTAAGTGLGALSSALRSLVRRASASRPTVLVSFGNPWMLRAFPQVPAYLLAWGPREVSQRAAARALLGEVPVSGRLPVAVGSYPAGHGIERDGVVRTVGALPPGPEGPEGPRGGGEAARADAPAHFTAPTRGGVPMTVRLGDEADPATAAMDAAALAGIDSLLAAAVAVDSVAPGMALAIGRRGRIVRMRGYGALDWGEGDAVTATSLYDLASVTKVVGTTTAVMMLEEADLVELDAPVVRYLPWWAEGDARKASVTVRQLLLHRAGLTPFRRWFLEMDGDEAYRRAAALEPLEWDPGTRTAYSDIGVMTLAWLVEAASGRRLDTFLEERLFGPLGMEDTGFLPGPARLPEIAPTEVDTLWRGVHVRGVVHDENADAMGGVAGHAGLFSTVRDLAVFADFMLRGGVAPPCAPGAGVPCASPRADSVRLLRPGTVERYTRRHDGSSGRALGWDTPSGRSAAGDYFTAAAFGHTGYTGTSIWLDPERDLFVILLSNRVNPTRDNARITPLRRAVHDAAARAVTDGPVRLREGGTP